MGAPSPGGTGWASYYLDDNSVYNGDTTSNGLGFPDRNGIFAGAYVFILLSSSSSSSSSFLLT